MLEQSELTKTAWDSRERDRVVQLQAKKHQGWPEATAARKRPGRVLPLEMVKECGPANTLSLVL